LNAPSFWRNRLIGATLVLAGVSLAGCGDEAPPGDEAVPGLKAPAASGPQAASIAPTTAAAVSSEDLAPAEPAGISLPPLPPEFANHVPTEEEADAAAAKEITNKNARQALEKLKKEIGGELGKKPR